MLTNLRPDLTLHLQRRLQAFREGFRQNLAMLGPPGSGKTFQLQQLLLRQPANLLLVYCPLYREPPRSFLNRLLCAVLQAGLPALRAPTEEVTQRSVDPDTGPPMEALLQRAERELPRTAIALRPVGPLIARRLYGEAFTRALDAIPVLVEERQQPCVLVLDEFLLLEEVASIHAFHELGKRVMTWPATLFILSSSSLYRARAILRERLQLLFGQFELLTLAGLDEGTTGAWIEARLSGLEGAELVSRFLVRWLGAIPRHLVMLLNRLNELSALRGAVRIDEPLFLQAAWDVVGNPDGALHQWCLVQTERLGQYPLAARALEALIHLAEGARTTTDIGRRLGRGGLSNALQLLTEHDLVQRSGTCWIMTDPILRCWLATGFLAPRPHAQLDATAIRRRFDRYVRGLWSCWSDASRLSFPEQVIDLFTKFRDDTVLLDSKTGRLPRFEGITRHQPSSPGAEAYLVADGPGKRWCATIHEGPVDENAIAGFEAFCRRQAPRPSRKVVIAKSGLDQNARLLAKTASMWVWEWSDLGVLMELYGQVDHGAQAPRIPMPTPSTGPALEHD